MSVLGGIGLIAPTLLTASSNINNSLEGIKTNGLVEGTVCYVQDVDGWFQLFPADTQTPDGSTIIAATGGGNWILQSTASPSPGAGDFALLPQVLYVFGDSAAAAETGSPAEPYKTLQAAIDATSDSPTTIYVVPQSAGSEGNISIPGDRKLEFISIGPPLEATLGTVAIELDDLPSKIRFDGFDMGAVTVAEGSTPPPGILASQLIFHNCRGSDVLDATATSSTRLTVYLNWEGALTAGSRQYEWDGSITGPDSTSGDWSLYISGNNQVNSPRVANSVSGFGVVMIQDAVLNGLLTCSNIYARRSDLAGIDGVASGFVDADGESWKSITSISNVPIVNRRTDSNYGNIGSGSGEKSVIYVDGNVIAGAGSPDAPFATVQEAIDSTDITTRYQILVAPGTYNEALLIPGYREISIIGYGNPGDTVIGLSANDWSIVTDGDTRTKLTLENISWSAGPAGGDIVVTGDGGFDLDLINSFSAIPSDAVDVSAKTSGTVRIQIQGPGKQIGANRGLSIAGSSSVSTSVNGWNCGVSDWTNIDSAELRDADFVPTASIDMKDATTVRLISCAGDINIAFPATGTVQLDGVSNYFVKNGGSITNGSKTIIDDLVP